jgi:hypothetical protein
VPPPRKPAHRACFVQWDKRTSALTTSHFKARPCKSAWTVHLECAFQLLGASAAPRMALMTPRNALARMEGPVQQAVAPSSANPFAAAAQQAAPAPLDADAFGGQGASQPVDADLFTGAATDGSVAPPASGQAGAAGAPRVNIHGWNGIIPLSSASGNRLIRNAHWNNQHPGPESVQLASPSSRLTSLGRSAAQA